MRKANDEHTNNMNRMKAGLMQFIGAIMTSNDSAVRQDGCAALCDALLALSYNKDKDEFDMWTMRPAFRAVWHVMKQRHNLMRKDLKNVEATPEVLHLINRYENAIGLLQNIAPPVENSKKEDKKGE